LDVPLKIFTNFSLTSDQKRTTHEYRAGVIETRLDFTNEPRSGKGFFQFSHHFCRGNPSIAIQFFATVKQSALLGRGTEFSPQIAWTARKCALTMVLGVSIF